MLSRRNFLSFSSGALVSLGLPVSVLAAISRETVKTQELTAFPDEQCNVYKDGLCVAQLQLVAMEHVSIAEPKVAQYIINFRALEPVKLIEASYAISIPSLGNLDLFLQPCGSFIDEQHDGVHYRACIAKLR